MQHAATVIACCYDTMSAQYSYFTLASVDDQRFLLMTPFLFEGRASRPLAFPLLDLLPAPPPPPPPPSLSPSLGVDDVDVGALPWRLLELEPVAWLSWLKADPVLGFLQLFDTKNI